MLQEENNNVYKGPFELCLCTTNGRDSYNIRIVRNNKVAGIIF